MPCFSGELWRIYLEWPEFGMCFGEGWSKRSLIEKRATGKNLTSFYTHTPLLFLLHGKWTSSFCLVRWHFFPPRASVFLYSPWNLSVFRTRYRTPIRALFCAECYQRLDFSPFLLNSIFFSNHKKVSISIQDPILCHWIMFNFWARGPFCLASKQVSVHFFSSATVSPEFCSICFQSPGPS